jgi:hypothetical protein
MAPCHRYWPGRVDPAPSGHAMISTNLPAERHRKTSPHKRPAPLSSRIRSRRIREHTAAHARRDVLLAQQTGNPSMLWFGRTPLVVTEKHAEETRQWWEWTLGEDQGSAT